MVFGTESKKFWISLNFKDPKWQTFLRAFLRAIFGRDLSNIKYMQVFKTMLRLATWRSEMGTFLDLSRHPYPSRLEKKNSLAQFGIKGFDWNACVWMSVSSLCSQNSISPMQLEINVICEGKIIWINWITFWNICKDQTNVNKDY